MQIGANTPAVITGGASGLGEATARMLAAAGAHVTLFDMNEAQGTALAQELGGAFLKVERNTVTHEIGAVEIAHPGMRRAVQGAEAS